jgi:hypothetical protein
LGKSALYNKIIMVVREIVSAHTMVIGTTVSARRGSTKSILSAVSCHHFREEMLS